MSLDHDNPSLLAQFLAAVMTVLAAVGGYISSLVISNTKKLYAMEQKVIDRDETMIRLHGEILSRQLEIIHRLDVVEDRLRKLDISVALLTYNHKGESDASQ